MEYNFDIEEIKDQVAAVIGCSQGFQNIINKKLNVKPLIDKWLNSKKYFIEKLDGNLIYELPWSVSFELDEKSKRNRLETFTGMVDSHYGNYLLYLFLAGLNPDDFYNNKTSKEYRIVDGDNVIIIPENFKVVKAFKFFVENKELLHKLQSEASELIQENIVTGRLCFSVHPLDFLSASENVHNWRSCHALDGDYRTGNLNYLMDSNTVICYLRAEKMAKLPHFPENIQWNSKKWRVWLFFSDDKSMLFAGRQYPFEANRGLELIKNNFLSPLTFGTYGPFYTDKLKKFQETSYNSIFRISPPMVPVGSTMRALDELIIDGEQTFHYNDLLHSSCYDPIYSYRIGSSFWHSEGLTGCTDKDKTKFHIGAACPCPICGQENIAFGEIMACYSCEDDYQLSDDDSYEVCDICGRSAYYEDMIDLELSDQRVCPTCFAREAVRCQDCGTADVPELVKYVPEDGRCLCPECKNRVLKKTINLIENIKFTI